LFKNVKTSNFFPTFFQILPNFWQIKISRGALSPPVPTPPSSTVLNLLFTTQKCIAVWFGWVVVTLFFSQIFNEVTLVLNYFVSTQDAL